VQGQQRFSNDRYTSTVHWSQESLPQHLASTHIQANTQAPEVIKNLDEMGTQRPGAEGTKIESLQATMWWGMG